MLKLSSGNCGNREITKVDFPAPEGAEKMTNFPLYSLIALTELIPQR
jgi:hypothetical protein